MKELRSRRSDIHLDHLEVFTYPSQNAEEDSLLRAFEQDVSRKYEHALVIGRYQPLHYGHIYLMKAALQIAKQITIGIGSANIHDANNPFTPEEREHMIYKVLQRDGLKEKVRKIVYLDDFINDDVTWFKTTTAKVGSINAIVGNNDWVNGIFRNGGIPAHEVPLLHRTKYEGKTIRAHLRSIGRL